MPTARTSPRIRIIVADDHPIVRKGLCQIVESDPALHVVAETATADDTLATAQRTPCDVVVLDLNMPGAVGLSVLKALREQLPAVPVLVMSMAPEDQFGARAVRAGAAGYISKRTAPEQLVDAIHRVVAGGLYVSSTTGQALAQDLLRPPARAGANAFRLSDRELEVLRLLGSGVSGEAIAARLGVSGKTVSTYRKRLLTKLGLDSTAALIRYAIEQGIADA
jgi:two-component system invasion response regulator UvrY